MQTNSGSGASPKVGALMSVSSLPQPLHFGLKKLSMTLMMFDKIFILVYVLITEQIYRILFE